MYPITNAASRTSYSEASAIFLHDQNTSMPTFNIPYEELSINEGRRQYGVNCIGIKAINSAKFLEDRLPKSNKKLMRKEFGKGNTAIGVILE